MDRRVRLALSVPRWAFRCYLRHLPLIGGLSLVPSVQRFVKNPTVIAFTFVWMVGAVRQLVLARERV